MVTVGMSAVTRSLKSARGPGCKKLLLAMTTCMTDEI